MDNNIPALKATSIYKTYPNEKVERENYSVASETDIVNFSFRHNDFFNAAYTEILKLISDLGFSTSKQIVTLLNRKKNTHLTQNKLQVILGKSSKQISFTFSFKFKSDIRPEGTNLNCYSISKKGVKYLQNKNVLSYYLSQYLLRSNLCKSHLIRNEYLIKILESDNLQNYYLNNDIEVGPLLTYSFNNDITHKLIAPRLNWEDGLFINLLKNNVSEDNNIKIIILGEDVEHIFELYTEILDNNINADNIYFTTDLRMNNRTLNNMYASFNMKYENGEEIWEINDLEINNF